MDNLVPMTEPEKNMWVHMLHSQSVDMWCTQRLLCCECCSVLLSSVRYDAFFAKSSMQGMSRSDTDGILNDFLFSIHSIPDFSVHVLNTEKVPHLLDTASTALTHILEWESSVPFTLSA